MSIRDINPYDWYKRFLSGSSRDAFGSRWSFDDMFREFDEMRKDMSRTFSEQFKNIENKVPKDLIKEYDTPEGGKVRQVGPIVYGYSMTIGPDGKPKIREFGNIKSPMGGMGSFDQPSLSAEREPLIDISSTDNEVKIVAEMPGISKDKINVNAYDKYVEIKSEDPNRKYHKKIEVPEDIDINNARSNYNNGVLEINFKKKEQQKPQGRQINVE